MPVLINTSDVYKRQTLRAGPAGPGRSEDGMSGKRKKGSAKAAPRADDRSVSAPTRSPRLGFGAVTNLCDATSALTVEGDLPSSLEMCIRDSR